MGRHAKGISLRDNYNYGMNSINSCDWEDTRIQDMHALHNFDQGKGNNNAR